MSKEKLIYVIEDYVPRGYEIPKCVKFNTAYPMIGLNIKAGVNNPYQAEWSSIMTVTFLVGSQEVTIPRDFVLVEEDRSYYGILCSEMYGIEIKVKAITDINEYGAFLQERNIRPFITTKEDGYQALITASGVKYLVITPEESNERTFGKLENSKNQNPDEQINLFVLGFEEGIMTTDTVEVLIENLEEASDIILQNENNEELKIKLI